MPIPVAPNSKSVCSWCLETTMLGCILGRNRIVSLKSAAVIRALVKRICLVEPTRVTADSICGRYSLVSGQANSGRCSGLWLLFLPTRSHLLQLSKLTCVVQYKHLKTYKGPLLGTNTPIPKCLRTELINNRDWCLAASATPRKSCSESTSLPRNTHLKPCRRS